MARPPLECVGQSIESPLITITPNPMSPKNDIIPSGSILSFIRSIRDQRVILDNDLAALYGVPTKRLNERSSAATWTASRRISPSSLRRMNGRL